MAVASVSVRAGLLDAFDLVGGVAGLDALGIGVVVLHQGEQAGAGVLNVGQLLEVAAVGFLQGSPEVVDGGAGLQLKAPVGRAGLDGVVGGVVAVVDAVVHDGLGKLRARGFGLGPEGLLGGLIPQGEIGVVGAGLEEQIHELGHARTVVLHALDGLGEQGGVAVVGGIAQDVHGEDDVVGGQGLAVGELDVVAQVEIIVNGAVGIGGDGQVGGAIVGVVMAVEGAGLAGLALLHDRAEAVDVEQIDGGQRPDVLVVGRLREERRELAGEVGITCNQRLFVALCAAAGQKRSHHGEAKEDRNNFFHLSKVSLLIM